MFRVDGGGGGGHSWASSPVQCSVLQEPLSNRRATGGARVFLRRRLSPVTVCPSRQSEIHTGWTFTAASAALPAAPPPLPAVGPAPPPQSGAQPFAATPPQTAP